MEILTKLSKSTTKSQKRRGRGIGSGVGGHTTGRGAKGSNVRGTTKLTFDGTKIKKSWIKRLPFLRGKHRTLKLHLPVEILNLDYISGRFQNGDIVSPQVLGYQAVKILATGDLTKKVVFKNVTFSVKAKEKIIAAGASIES